MKVLYRFRFYRKRLGGHWYKALLPMKVVRWYHGDMEPYVENFGTLLEEETYYRYEQDRRQGRR